ALRRPRRHLGREEGILRQLDEDRPAGVPPDGGRGAGLRQLRLPDRRPPPDAGHGRGEEAGREGPPALAAAQGLRHLISSRYWRSPCWATRPIPRRAPTCSTA